MNRKKIILTGMALWCLLAVSQAQEAEVTSIEKLEEEQQEVIKAIKQLRKLKISGYVQAQGQWGEADASLKVGSPSEHPGESFSRIGIRRGRLKLSYEEGFATGVFQLDLTEKGIAVKDAYLNARDPWFNSLSSLQAGIFYRPFGDEINNSSSRRESPERATIFQTLFPDERDLGVAIALQAPSALSLSIFRLEAGIFAGNGIKPEIDSRKDVIAHLTATKDFGNTLQLSGGISYYNGGVFQGSEVVYTLSDKAFVANHNPANKGKYAKREYTGFDMQIGLRHALGLMQLRAEYIFGTQPGTASGSKSPNAASLPDVDVYIRPFAGGYIIFVQDIGTLPFSAAVKYDQYDPNTAVSGNDVSPDKHTSAADLALQTTGFGMIWRMNSSLRLQAWYEINKNETAENLSSYREDKKDNVVTVRLQYRF